MKTKTYFESIKTLEDDELLYRLSELLHDSRRVESELIAHIAEVDFRRLYARKAASSMFCYCTEVLHLSEHEAYLRIEVARASRKHPALLEMLADGRLHLSGIALICRHLTEENREALLNRAVHKTKRQIEELVAEISPKPDVKATIRKKPERRREAKQTRSQLGPDRVQKQDSIPAQNDSENEKASPTQPTSAPEKSAEEKPIAKGRYKVTFTASAELRDKLERLKALRRSSVPDGDLAAVIEEAVTEKLERLEAKRYGKTKTPRKSLEEADTLPSSRYIPAPIRRTVYERDGGQCTYQTEDGRRCSERNRLEFHHDRRPYGRGGDHEASNVRLMCRTHNMYMAERDYGKDVMNRYRRSSHRVFAPPTTYHIDWGGARA